ncbi:hypothetical protein OG689_42475 [Kitasatospora sp. NBC_00240]|uniref:hypothetical protein n=1 Tax=Kitasatospora sp. NBC_00240 TaxID=2903567 RepID=UPI002255F5E5|nr:hypothetical protein [Kitasatospora sp. NBC_00240]MCX5215818.1 hypothetical protein [Kitasatospora sp. NBC_00240]
MSHTPRHPGDGHPTEARIQKITGILIGAAVTALTAVLPTANTTGHPRSQGPTAAPPAAAASQAAADNENQQEEETPAGRELHGHQHPTGQNDAPAPKTQFRSGVWEEKALKAVILQVMACGPSE